MQDTIHIGLQQPPSPLMQADVTTHTQTRKQTYTLSLEPCRTDAVQTVCSSTCCSLVCLLRALLW